MVIKATVLRALSCFSFWGHYRRKELAENPVADTFSDELPSLFVALCADSLWSFN